MALGYRRGVASIGVLGGDRLAAFECLQPVIGSEAYRAELQNSTKVFVARAIRSSVESVPVSALPVCPLDTTTYLRHIRALNTVGGHTRQADCGSLDQRVVNLTGFHTD